MVYILPNLDLNFIKIKGTGFAEFSLWTTTEERIRAIIANERCRSIFSKKEIVGLFGGMKMQMVKVTEITPEVWDKVLTWTDDGRWFVMEFTSFEEVPMNVEVGKKTKLPIQDVPTEVWDKAMKPKKKTDERWVGLAPVLKRYEPKTI